MLSPPESSATWALVGASIFTGAGFVEDHALVIAGAQIEALVPVATLGADIHRVECAGGRLVPGLIDLQINGAGGVFFTQESSVSALTTMTHTLARLGTTGFLPTVISAPAAVHAAAETAVAQARALGNRAVLGVHLEGPFFAATKRGCHPAAALRDFTAADAERLSAVAAGVRLLTLAPERIAPDAIGALVEAGNIVALGHTNASYETTMMALAAGASGFTHLFNAMSQLSGREPGVVGAALSDPASWCGIICDGHHVHAASIRAAAAAKAAGKLILVSDAMAPLGAPEASFELDGERITQRDGRLVNAQGNLAGSAVSLLTCVRLAHQWAGLPLAQALQMATAYPAQIIGREAELGRLAPGCIADILHLDEDLNLTAVWVGGVRLSG